MNIKCPHCGKATDLTGNPFRPFCSERCKLLDLGNWISGAYRIPEQESEATEEEAPDLEKDSNKE
ncbi:MAG: DNA gyrase inhibitor YacG [Acidobacteria bacterium]|nr:DNA gyrase inhibitor YacG [Acidobacteriota bacterium]